MVVLTIAAVTLFSTLGLWQLERANFKQDIEDQYESRLAADYRVFEKPSDWQDIAFQKVELVGKFDIERSLLLDNQLNQGKAGYHVITPFRLSSGDLVLVNRGWVPTGDSREQLPSLETPINLESAKGIVILPTDDIYRMGDITIGDKWPQVIPYIDIEALQPAFGTRLLPFVIWFGVDQPGLYVRDWQPVWLKPEKSRAYAWQWFAFALIASILFFILNLRKLHD